MKKSVLKFDKNALAKVMFDNLVEEQTQRLVDYAKRNVRLIGDAMMMYNSKYHMDRTGNLLNSLCWTVAYGGRLIDSGFYRDERINGVSSATKDIINKDGHSYLHEWSPDRDVYVVNGREMAKKYIKQHGHHSVKGYWRVTFAVLAPYWGYWEEGFMLHGRRLQFNVMEQMWGKVSDDLKPAKVTFKTEAPTYWAEKHKLAMEKYDKRGNKSIYE